MVIDRIHVLILVEVEALCQPLPPAHHNIHNPVFDVNVKPFDANSERTIQNTSASHETLLK